ncbi:energy-coupling factor ABC transporter permease [Ruegeria sp. 2012CJ41-6]|uniref:Energy-coupling factor ABC transporter permease n=1 Tax=Ruegeria spongiae TaxID=2942209 RepID=A0ABT0Q2K3_9RHOB|nr:energy-coupling factor ABC transporter permease [Ruegeria spongiae]MCL6284101.1 energy-coupling factor ABC transporter permease [Ruegeria spongiae]
MHIEPGVVHGAKMVFAYGTAAAAAGYSLKLIADDLKERAATSFVARSIAATLGVFIFFEVLPHFPVGISEVHFILGTTLLLILGAAPAAVGLAAGLAIQGLLFAPSDVPMYFVNLTTLLVPLFGIHALAKRALPQNVAYVDLGYADVLKLSAAYQGGVIAWVAFWAFYGQGFGAENMAAVGSFGMAYMLVVLVEPVFDLAVLAGAKSLKGLKDSGLVTSRLYHAA